MTAGDTTHQDPTPTLAAAVTDVLLDSTHLIVTGNWNLFHGDIAADLTIGVVLAYFGCSSEAELMELVNIGRLALELHDADVACNEAPDDYFGDKPRDAIDRAAWAEQRFYDAMLTYRAIDR